MKPPLDCRFCLIAAVLIHLWHPSHAGEWFSETVTEDEEGAPFGRLSLVAGEVHRRNPKKLDPDANIPIAGGSASGGFEGDIHDRSNVVLDAFENQRDSVSPTAQNAAIDDSTAVWPNKKVPYVVSKRFTEKARDKLSEAMAEFHLHTCIRFEPRQADDRDYILFSTYGSGCSSDVGRLGGRQNVTLATAQCFAGSGIIIHELMHALGFYHEQARFDRDKFLEILWENIAPSMDRNFLRYDAYQITTMETDYDYGSIMHYPVNAFSQNGQPTIVPRMRGASIGQRNGMSKTDIYEVKKFYKCPNIGDKPALDQPLDDILNSCDEGGDYDVTEKGCCGGQLFKLSTQICCEDTISDIPTSSGVRRRLGCCGKQPYFGGFDCCDEVPFNLTSHRCCYNKVQPIPQTSVDCDGNPLNNANATATQSAFFIRNDRKLNGVQRQTMYSITSGGVGNNGASNTGGGGGSSRGGGGSSRGGGSSYYSGGGGGDDYGIASEAGDFFSEVAAEDPSFADYDMTDYNAIYEDANSEYVDFGEGSDYDYGANGGDYGGDNYGGEYGSDGSEGEHTGDTDGPPGDGDGDGDSPDFYYEDGSDPQELSSGEDGDGGAVQYGGGFFDNDEDLGSDDDFGGGQSDGADYTGGENYHDGENENYGGDYDGGDNEGGVHYGDFDESADGEDGNYGEGNADNGDYGGDDEGDYGGGDEGGDSGDYASGGDDGDSGDYGAGGDLPMYGGDDNEDQGDYGFDSESDYGGSDGDNGDGGDGSDYGSDGGYDGGDGGYDGGDGGYDGGDGGYDGGDGGYDGGDGGYDGDDGGYDGGDGGYDGGDGGYDGGDGGYDGGDDYQDVDYGGDYGDDYTGDVGSSNNYGEYEDPYGTYDGETGGTDGEVIDYEEGETGDNYGGVEGSGETDETDTGETNAGSNAGASRTWTSLWRDWRGK